MADPIVPNYETGLLDGQVVLYWCTKTAAGATTRVTCDLPTHAPFIDLRIGHPVLSIYSISNEGGGAGTDREVFDAAHEMERGVSADSAGEWDLVDHNTVGIYNAADAAPGGDGLIAITYIAFGGARA
jgi:hypothetical protein